MDLDARAFRLARDWNRRPSRATAKALGGLLRKRGLSAAARGAALVPLGEAAEMDCDFALAHAHYVSVVATTDPLRDERLYARAAARCLLNTPRIHQLDALHGVDKLVRKLNPNQRTPRLMWLGALARGLLALTERDWNGARKALEEAMGAAWESDDPEAEALAHHLLGQTWIRLAKVARARQHVDAAHAAARRSGLWVIVKRLELERVLFSVATKPRPRDLAELRRLVGEVRKTGYPRLESLAWTRLAPCVPQSGAFLARAEKLVRQAPPRSPDRLLLRTVRRAVDGRKESLPLEPKLKRQIATLAKFALG